MKKRNKTMLKEKAGIILGFAGLLILGAAANTYSQGDMETAQFLIQFMAGLEAMAASYLLLREEDHHGSEGI